MRSPGKSDATWEVHPVHHRGVSTTAFILFRKINGNAELWLIYTEENSQSNLCCPVPAPLHSVLEASAETAMAQDTTAIPPCTSLSAQSNPKFKPSANTSSKNLTGHLQEVSPKGLYVCIDISTLKNLTRPNKKLVLTANKEGAQDLAAPATYRPQSSGCEVFHWPGRHMVKGMDKAGRLTGQNSYGLVSKFMLSALSVTDWEHFCLI